MNETSDNIARRKSEHLTLCLTDEVAFKAKTNGFDHYDFLHNAVTDVEIDKIRLSTKFFSKKINYPFLISCMTGGAKEAENINTQLAFAAQELNIPIGVGSQRQLLSNKKHINSYKVIRQNAKNVPVLGNIGAAQVIELQKTDTIKYLIEIIEADAMVIHINPLQELLQKDGDINFKGFLKAAERVIKENKIPFIIKEVGSGISDTAAKRLLDAGFSGIDVAGSGGTSWAGVELLRHNNNSDNILWDWGIPTSYCIRKVFKLKKDYNFVLIGSGGINNPFDSAKAIALGADMTASARIILQELNNKGIEGVVKLVNLWFETLKKIMYLTGSKNLTEFRKNKIIKKKDLY